MELFVEKAHRILNGSYVRSLNENGNRLNISGKFYEKPTISVEYIAPDTDAKDALITTYRMFQQENDRISLRNMAKIASDPHVTQDWKDHFSFAYKFVNKYLDGIPDMDLSPEGKTLSAREILDTFIYGEYAHTNKKKRDRYLKWKSEPMMFSLISLAFDRAMSVVINVIRYISELCELELENKPIPANPEMTSPPYIATPLFKAELTPNTDGITSPVIQSVVTSMATQVKQIQVHRRKKIKSQT